VLAEAEAICDKVAIIREGQLTRVGTIQELKALAPRRVRMTFDGTAPIDAYSVLPEISEIDQPEPHVIELMTRSEPGDLIQILAAHPPQDIVWQEVTLEEIFLGYYRTRGTARHDA
jgi:ABC-2 type transport system ATP-binding protein